jgi:hypothetical protein
VGGHGRAGALRAVAVAAALLAGCASRPPARGREDPTAQELRIWISPIVRWDAGAPRHVELALENATHRTLVIAAPDPANAAVGVFAGPESTRLCGVEPSAEPRARGRVELAPGDRAEVRVDLDGACAGVPPGVYRYEAGYRAPEVPGGATAVAEGAVRPRPFSGTLATSYGQVIVEEGARAAEAAAAPEEDGARPPARAGRRPPRSP